MTPSGTRLPKPNRTRSPEDRAQALEIQRDRMDAIRTRLRYKAHGTAGLGRSSPAIDRALQIIVALLFECLG